MQREAYELMIDVVRRRQSMEYLLVCLQEQDIVLPTKEVRAVWFLLETALFGEGDRQASAMTRLKERHLPLQLLPHPAEHAQNKSSAGAIRIGTRNFESLNAACEAAIARDVIRLGAGTFAARGIVMQRQVKIVGLSPEQTTIQFSDTLVGLTVFQGSELLNLTLALTAPSNSVPDAQTTVLQVLQSVGDASVRFSNMVVQGGDIGIRIAGDVDAILRDVHTTRNTIGLLIEGSGQVHTFGFHASENVQHGVFARGRSWLLLDGATIETSGDTGIFAQDLAEIVVQDAVLRLNNASGMSVKGSGHGYITSSVLDRNGAHGVVFDQDATGEVRLCNVLNNGGFGVLVAGNSSPDITNNEVVGNTNDGINYANVARGLCKGNRCVRNKKSGILVGDASSPTVEDNTCLRNRFAGIAFFGIEGIATNATNNECVQNRTGITVNRQASPTLRYNICTDNATSGIAFWNKTGGIAQDNVCVRNRQDDYFQVEGSSARIVLTKQDQHKLNI